MPYVIPTDAHQVGDPNHTPDHNNITDMLRLLTATLGEQYSTNVATALPASDGTNIAAVQAALAGMGAKPWQFQPEAYGAKGDGRIITDATMVSGSPNLTSASQAQFSSADVGKSVLVSAAGGGTYSPLGSTITAPCYIVSVTSATVAVLSVNASSTTPGASLAVIATDDSASFLACQAAQIAYCQSHQHGYAELLGSNKLYGLGAGQAFTATNASPAVFTVPAYAYPNGTKVYLSGTVPTGFSAGTGYFVVNNSGLTFQLSATSGGSAINSTSTGSGLVQYSPVNYGGGLGNSLLPLAISAPASQKIIPVFTGPTKTQDQALIHWNQLVPQSALSQIVCMRTDGTNDGTYGPAHVVGSPIDGYGQDLGSFTNMMPVVDGMQILVPYNSTYGGWDFFGCAQAVMLNGSVMTLAVVNVAAPTGAPYPSMFNGPSNISNQWGWGCRMPCTGNNDRCDVVAFSSEGLCYGLGPSEHCMVMSTRNHYGITGIEAYSGNGVGMAHAGRIYYASTEGNTNSLGFFDGTINLDVDDLDSEIATTLVYDPSNRGYGTIKMRFAGGAGNIGYNSSPSSIFNSAEFLNIICLDNASMIGMITSGAPAAPATTVAQINGYYQPAFVWITSTAAITAVKVGNNVGTMTAITGLTTAGAGTVMVPVPSGRYYSVTSTGTITTQWQVNPFG